MSRYVTHNPRRRDDGTTLGIALYWRARSDEERFFDLFSLPSLSRWLWAQSPDGLQSSRVSSIRHASSPLPSPSPHTTGGHRRVGADIPLIAGLGGDPGTPDEASGWLSSDSWNELSLSEIERVLALPANAACATSAVPPRIRA